MSAKKRKVPDDSLAGYDPGEGALDEEPVKGISIGKRIAFGAITSVLSGGLALLFGYNILKVFSLGLRRFLFWFNYIR